MDKVTAHYVDKSSSELSLPCNSHAPAEFNMFAIHITLSYVLHSKGFSGERRRHREGMNVGDGGGYEEGAEYS